MPTKIQHTDIRFAALARRSVRPSSRAAFAFSAQTSPPKTEPAARIFSLALQQMFGDGDENRRIGGAKSGIQNFHQHRPPRVIAGAGFHEKSGGAPGLQAQSLSGSCGMSKASSGKKTHCNR